MNRNKVLTLIMSLILVFTVLSGCGKPAPASSDVEIVESPDEENGSDEVKGESEEQSNPLGVPSPLSGIYTDKENISRRPIAVMLDNQSKARPQAGLDQAEIIYEALAEGGITRYMAIFLMNAPESIGPVRSARPYFIDKALEYDALYVHVGGSPQAFVDIKELKVADIDAMSRDGSIFWRKNHKKAPHNMYTSTNALRKAAQNSNYKAEGDFSSIHFNGEDADISGSLVSYVEIPYFKDYHPSFQYNEEDRKYYRSINGAPHLDEISKIHLHAKNIIIQKCDTEAIDSVGRLEMKVTGTGTGYFLTNGKMMEITWEKKSRKARTKYFDGNGKEIRLNPGVTWIELIPMKLESIFQ
ncbi:hypothetical protein HNQ80_004054 [Anaerosolibacter carboniphilus]|uniref:Lipoprotein YerB n=1 Tax=Anaerosolibacter carboniphilus TaxID=1417629 RepID=A0A841L015_9FIRM|nr:DUF3048 domain-containing protein [Anaerosolibacter carboniphilus]MBB6217918.1 hypothetical protein [Anaerosolibacter carboniphilus]